MHWRSRRRTSPPMVRRFWAVQQASLLNSVRRLSEHLPPAHNWGNHSVPAAVGRTVAQLAPLLAC